MERAVSIRFALFERLINGTGNAPGSAHSPTDLRREEQAYYELFHDAYSGPEYLRQAATSAGNAS